MVFDVSVAMTWLLFLALFPIAFYWLRRAWRIFIKKDYSEVALRRGLPPPNPEKFAVFTGTLNLTGGIIMVFVVLGVASGQMAYETWTAIAGSTIWMKFIFDFILSRHAHPIVPRKRGEAKNDAEPKSQA